MSVTRLVTTPDLISSPSFCSSLPVYSLYASGSFVEETPVNLPFSLFLVLTVTSAKRIDTPNVGRLCEWIVVPEHRTTRPLSFFLVSSAVVSLTLLLHFNHFWHYYLLFLVNSYGVSVKLLWILCSFTKDSILHNICLNPFLLRLPTSSFLSSFSYFPLWCERSTGSFGSGVGESSIIV